MTGEQLFGKFNPTGNETVEKIKTICAELHDIVENTQTTGKMSAAIRISAQINLLDFQMKAVKLLFLPDEGTKIDK